MHITPVINCQDRACATERFRIARELMGEAGMVHVDLADGSLTQGYTTWRQPEELKQLIEEYKLRVGLHVMVQHPEQELSPWLTTGVSRVIIHQETISDVASVLQQCREKGIEVVLGLTMATPPEVAAPLLEHFDGALVLAVAPGKTGQQFNEAALAYIRTLHALKPGVPIVVDGGVTPEIAKHCKEAGAVQVAVGAFLFDAPDTKAAYQEFVAL